MFSRKNGFLPERLLAFDTTQMILRAHLWVLEAVVTEKPADSNEARSSCAKELDSGIWMSDYKDLEPEVQE